jgi:hypothetical protein
MMEALEDVEIVAPIGERGTFRLKFRLDPGSKLPARFLLDTGDLVRTVLVLAVGNQPTVAMDGVMVEHAVSTNGEDRFLVIAGEDLTLLMDRIDATGRPYPALAIATRIQLILTAYAVNGVVPEVIPAPLTDLPSPTERIFHQRGTDYAYIRSLAAEVGYRFTLNAGPLPGESVAYWGPEPRTDRVQPSLTINFERPDNVDRLELRFDTMHRIDPEATILDSGTKVLIPVPVPNINALRLPLGAIVPPAQKHARLHETAKLSPLQAAARLLAVAARSAESMTGSGVLNVRRNDLRLRAGDLVEVRAASKPFNGLFAVRRVHDRITARNHLQEFELVRAGIGAAP